MAAALLDGAVRLGVRVLTGTRLKALRRYGGRVVAAAVEHEGTLRDITASAVILATGGFDRDLELRARLLPAAVGATGAAPGNTGDGLRIAVEAGARLENTGQGWWMPMIEIPGRSVGGQQYYQSLIRERALPRQILVNAAGRRFANEALPYNELGKAMNRQNLDEGYPNMAAWMVFDEGFRQRYTFPAARPGGPLPGWALRVGSLAGLAVAAGLDLRAFAETVGRWNRDCASGTDREFGRGADAYERFMGDPGAQHPNLGPIDQPPYYAVKVLSGTIGTKGGPVTDADGRVLAADGRPVGGLYAAGNTAAFWTPTATLGRARPWELR